MDIRQDPYWEAHPKKVEEDKKQDERGLYLHPEVYGQPKEKGIEYAHRPPEPRTSDAAEAAGKAGDGKPVAPVNYIKLPCLMLQAIRHWKLSPQRAQSFFFSVCSVVKPVITA